jgi:hypothetical protein
LGDIIFCARYYHAVRLAILSVVLFLSGISALIFESHWLLAGNALAAVAIDQ